MAQVPVGSVGGGAVPNLVEFELEGPIDVVGS